MRRSPPTLGQTQRRPQHARTTAQRGLGSRWQSFRRAVMVHYRWTCLVCLESGRFEQATELHHIVPREQNLQLAREFDNVLPVCRACHREVEGWSIERQKAILNGTTG